MENKKERACPCCDSKERVTVVGADKFILISFTIANTGVKIEVVACANCGCVYVS